MTMADDPQVPLQTDYSFLRCTLTSIDIFWNESEFHLPIASKPLGYFIYVSDQLCTSQTSCLKISNESLSPQFKLTRMKHCSYTSRSEYLKENLLPKKTPSIILLNSSKANSNSGTNITDAGELKCCLLSKQRSLSIYSLSNFSKATHFIGIEDSGGLILHCIPHPQTLIVLIALCWLWLFAPLLLAILSIHRLSGNMSFSQSIDFPSIPYPGPWRGQLPEGPSYSDGNPTDADVKESPSFWEKDFFEDGQFKSLVQENEKWQQTSIGKGRAKMQPDGTKSVPPGHVSWLAALLLLANDVEVHPGPISCNTRPELGDLTTIPDIDGAWKDLGSALLLDSVTLDKISSKHTNPSRCKREMFRALLKKSSITWAKVLDALSDLGYENVVSNVCQELEITYGGQSSSRRTSPPLIHTSSVKPVSSSSDVNWSTMTCDPVQAGSYTTKSSSYLAPQKSKHQTPSPPPSYASSQPIPRSLISPHHASSAIVGTTMESDTLRPSAGLKTFDQFRNRLLKELSEDPILITNKAFSVGLMTLNQLHDLRVISSNRNKASTLMSHVEARLHKEQQAFELFVGSLRSISTHVTLADEMSRVYRLNLVWRRMVKFSERELDFTFLCTDLNNQKLISDPAQEQSFKLQDPFSFCHFLFKELHTMGIGDQFLDLLDAFENTKSFRAAMKDFEQKLGGVALRPQGYESSHQDPPKGKDRTSPRSPNTSEKQDQLLTVGGQKVRNKAQVVVVSISSNSTPLTEPDHQRLDGNVSPGIGNKVGIGSPRRPQNSYSPSDFLIGVEGGRNMAHPQEKDVATSEELPNRKLESDTLSAVVSNSNNDTKGHGEVDMALELKRKEQERLFVEAVNKRDTVKMDSILTMGFADKEHRFKNHRTALMIAAKEDRKEATQVLLKHSASVVAVDVKGYSALYLAGKYGNYELMQMILKETKVDVNIRSKAGVPLLVRVAEKGFSVITECLLEHGALPDAVSEDDGMTALYVSSKHGHKDVVKLLLDTRVDVTRICPKTQCTPLEEAMAGTEPDVVSMLMKAEYKIKKKSHELFTAINPEVVGCLVTKDNAMVDIRNHLGATALLVHAQFGKLDVVKKLIQLEANVDLQDNMGMSALMVSCKAGHVEVVQVLISAGVILDLKERENGCTALMFAVIGSHVDVVRDLVMAKASFYMRNKDGKSACDLARENGNTEIMNKLKVQNDGRSHKDEPFMHLLSSYMNSKASNPRLMNRAAARSAEPHQTTNSKNHRVSREGSSAKSGQLPLGSSVPDESSSEELELKKCYKRIADLEMRVNDITTTSNTEPTVDEDMTYMDRVRLEAEYKKLKDAKKKAENYAVEAKQIAQRLSAENFKLREDLNKERHFNELTRKPTIEELEQGAEISLRRSQLELVRASVFQEEVAERAYQLVQNDPQRGLIYKKVSLSSLQLKDIILTQSVPLGMFQLRVHGLPCSGKTTLCKSMGLTRSQTSGTGPLGLDIYQAVMKPAILSDHEHQWMEMSDLRADIAATSLMHFLVGQHQLPMFASSSRREVEVVFDDAEVQANFKTVCDSLHQLSSQFSGDNELEKLLTGSYSLVNIFDVGAGQAVQEIVDAFGDKNSNLLMLDVIDVSRYSTDTLMKPLDLKDGHYDSRYDSFDVGPHSALHHLTTCLKDASCEESSCNNCIIVGTHADKFTSGKLLNTRKSEILNLVKSCASDMGVSSCAVRPAMVTVDARDHEQSKAVTSAVVELANLHKKSFEMDVPLLFIFFRWCLHNTKLMFISRPSLVQRAGKCHIRNEREVDRFLELFRRCGSIITSPFKTDFLYHHIILLPGEFFHGLSRLYCMKKDACIPQNLLQDVQHGIITERLMRSVWQGSTRDRMRPSDFYSSVLQSVGLACKCGEDQYFIPSLISKYDVSVPESDSSSLIIVSDGLDIPYRKQCEFVKYFKSHEKLKGLLEFKKSLYYNTTQFAWKSKSDGNPDVTVRFSRGFIEVSVGRFFNGMTGTVYSLLKTAIVDIMRKISANMRSFRFKLNIVCPGELKLHFIPFDLLESSVDAIQCPTCAERLNPDKKVHAQKLLWIQAAYTGSPLSAMHPDDILNPSNLLTICKKLISSSDLLKLCRDLSYVSMQSSSSPPDYTMVTKEHISLEEVLFHALYNWHCQHVTASKPMLARLLRDKGFYQEAIALDSSLYSEISTEERVSTVRIKEVAILADWWPAGVKDLAKVLKVKPTEAVTSRSSDVEKCAELLKTWLEETKGDQRRKLYDLFTDNEYYVSNILSL